MEAEGKKMQQKEYQGQWGRGKRCSRQPVNLSIGSLWSSWVRPDSSCGLWRALIRESVRKRERQNYCAAGEKNQRNWEWKSEVGPEKWGCEGKCYNFVFASHYLNLFYLPINWIKLNWVKGKLTPTTTTTTKKPMYLNKYSSLSLISSLRFLDINNSADFDGELKKIFAVRHNWYSPSFQSSFMLRPLWVTSYSMMFCARRNFLRSYKWHLHLLKKKHCFRISYTDNVLKNLHHRQTGRYYQLLFGLLLNIFLVVQSMVIMPLFACVYIILEFSGLKPCSLAWMLPTNPLHTCESKLAIFQRHCYNVFKTFLINPKHKEKTLW